ncbi:hypothetical protein PG987_011257 [Apiospora arundinis]
MCETRLAAVVSDEGFPYEQNDLAKKRISWRRKKKQAGHKDPAIGLKRLCWFESWVVIKEAQANIWQPNMKTSSSTHNNNDEGVSRRVQRVRVNWGSNEAFKMLLVKRHNGSGRGSEVGDGVVLSFGRRDVRGECLSFWAGLGVALAKSRSVRAAKDVHLHATPENMQEEMK